VHLHLIEFVVINFLEVLYILTHDVGLHLAEKCH